MKSESRPVNIDFELQKKAEVLAIDKGITITEFIEEAIREKIDKEKAHKIQTQWVRRFLYFLCFMHPYPFIHVLLEQVF